MWTLEEREVLNDRLWESLIEQTTDDDEMEIIRAIELNYKCIELLREKKRVLDLRESMMRAEQERRRLL
ncbi:hypothetical protein LCGC14_1815550 [marine sediment metagenome]|uniref:Uncharacterized protein n=1 Tax=marine sediment metagenome TaxID=412755 RepID=A0A0F9JK52_9ZZZZ